MNKGRRGRDPGTRLLRPLQPQQPLLPALLFLWALLLVAQALGRHHQIVHALPAGHALHAAASGGAHAHAHGEPAHAEPEAPGWAEAWSGPHEAGDATCRLADAACGADASAPTPARPPCGGGPAEPPQPAAQPPLRTHGPALRQARGPPELARWAAPRFG